MKNIDNIGMHSIELTTQVWNTYRAWSTNMADTAGNSRKYIIKTPSLDSMVEAISPQIYAYLQEDDQIDVGVKVQLLRSALQLMGHGECAKALRESVQSAGGKKMEDFKGLDTRNRQDRALIALGNLAGYVVESARTAHEAVVGLEHNVTADKTKNTRVKP